MTSRITNVIRTIQAIGPILGNALRSGRRFNLPCELTETDPGIPFESDGKIPRRERGDGLRGVAASRLGTRVTASNALV